MVPLSNLNLPAQEVHAEAQQHLDLLQGQKLHLPLLLRQVGATLQQVYRVASNVQEDRSRVIEDPECFEVIGSLEDGG